MERVTRKLSNLLITFIILFGGFASSLVFTTVVLAQGSDISSTVVTDLSVSSTEIQDGGKVAVTVNFAENSSHNIQNGDTITVGWTNSGQPTFNGYTKTLPLTVKGVNVGEAVIRQDGATITFNSSVDNLEDVSGYVTFEIEGRNTTNTTSEDKKSGTIFSGGKSTTVTVVKPEAGVNSVFYYKTGSMYTSDTEHVNWWLNANLNKSYVDSDIRIEDSIQGGQELVTDSFEITVSGNSNTTLSGANALTDFAKQYPGSSITVNGNNITVVIAQGYASLNQFSIYYKTKITDQSQKQFVNYSKAWYTENGKDAVNGEDFNYAVDNVNANAGVTGTVKGELKIVKKTKGTAIAIPGVTFELKNTEGTAILNGEAVLKLVTDANGVANVKGLPVGNYVVKEVSAPDWIDFDLLKSQELTFTVNDSDIEGTLLNVENETKKTTVSGTKTWNDNRNQDGKRPASITVNLLANGEKVASKEVTASENWVYSFDNLEAYKDGKQINYTVTEEAVADYTTTVDGYNLINSYTPGKTAVTVNKVWSDNNNQDGKRPGSVSVQLYANGEAVDGKVLELTPDNNWTAQFTNLDEKADGKVISYTVKEVIVPSGYISTVDTTDAKNLIITNAYTTETTEVSGTKTWKDGDDKDGIRPNAITVKLLANGQDTGLTTVATADTKWSYTFKNIAKYANGKAISYTVEEVNVPLGYTATVDGMNITNSYTPKQDKPTPPSKSNDKSTKKDEPTSLANSNTKPTKKENLPLTNSIDNPIYAIFGLILLGLGIGYTIRKKKFENG